jgi:tetratricopeptide (TPR) repeat protein
MSLGVTEQVAPSDTGPGQAGRPREQGSAMEHTEYDYDLGSYGRTVTTSSPEAQRWFDRGLVWSYAFHHEEAVSCFEAAARADPDCAMAYWGIAYALGPNYNKPWEFFDEQDLVRTVARTHEAVELAHDKAVHASPVERALIGALRARYPQKRPAKDCSVWNAPYADAMRAVHDLAPDDLDVAALYADALMNLTPWQLWDLRTGEPAEGARTLEAKAVLDRALATAAAADHPGVLHLYVHLLEMSPAPETALPVADRLRDLVPDAGHLLHMPSHLEVLCGDYRAVVSDNTRAIAADEKYRKRAGAMNFYTLYRAHNHHFKIYGAMFLGQAQVALEAVDRLEASLPEELLRVESPPMADWLEAFLAMRVHVLIRFGRWADILELPEPADPELYSMTTAMRHYARGVALSATGRIPEAEAERAVFEEAVIRVPQTRMLFNNTCADILAIASSMLDGELEYRKGNHEAAFAALERSIELDDNLPYDEPWGWMQPTRHAYGALLLEQGRVAEAEAVYRADLGLDDTLPRPSQHPGNVWSLHGLHECLVRLGKEGEARIVAQQLKFATALTDVPVEASCFCRLDTASGTPGTPGCCGMDN